MYLMMSTPTRLGDLGPMGCHNGKSSLATLKNVFLLTPLLAPDLPNLGGR